MTFTAFLIALVLGAAPVVPAPPTRSVAVTIDDLPLADLARHKTPRARLETVRALTDLITQRRLPVTGFFNLAMHEDDPRLLPLWQKAGVEIGNHTWSHPRLGKVGLARYLKDLDRGHRAVQKLLPPGATVWFRYPYLYQGFEGDERARIRAHLKTLGARHAPVTIDTSDWLHARGWLKARQARDTGAMARWHASWRADLEESTLQAEMWARELFGREPPQILLLHGNALNAAHLGEYLDWLVARGYRLISLGEAMADAAYTEEDQSLSPTGDSHWLRLRRSRAMAADR